MVIRFADSHWTTVMIKNSPVYYWQESDGYYVCIDGRPDFFNTSTEMYLFAASEGRDVIQVTDENDQALRESGAFNGQEDF